MNTCPACNIRLTDNEIIEGRCLECGATFEGSPPADGPSHNPMQTIDAAALPVDLDDDSLDFDEPQATDEPAPPAGNMQTIDAAALPVDLDDDSLDFDEPQATDEPAPPAGNMQTIDATALPVDLDDDSLDFDEPQATDEPAPPAGNMQTIDAAALPVDLDDDSLDFDEPKAADEPAPPAGNMQTIDAAALPVDLDDDSLDFDEPEAADEPAQPAGNMQTIDAAALPVDLDDDSLDFDEPEAADEPAPPAGNMQTIDAAALPVDLDDDSLDFDEPEAADEPAPPAGNMQTIDAAALPVDLDDDSLDFDEPEAANEPAPPAGNMQTIDAAALPVDLDDDSLDFDEPDAADEPAPPAGNMQTIDAAALPVDLDDDSLDFDAGTDTLEDAKPSYQQTVDAASLDMLNDSDSVDFDDDDAAPRPAAPMQTLDASSLPVDADSDSLDFDDKGTGTVSDRVGAQTIDSVTVPGDASGGTVAERQLNATIDSTDIGDGGGTVGDRQVAATFDSSDIADDPARMDGMWGGDQNAGANPRMTIKGRESAPKPGSQTLAIKPRSFREVEEERAFGGAAEYDLMKKLGEGGMGVVYLGRQANIDRNVAIKMLKPKMASDANQRNKFLTEAVITGDLDHPNIVPIYDLGANDDGALFYAMKCVKGTPWDECIRKKSLSENIEIFLKTCDAVAFGHSRGIIHRDLKPENTMIGGFGEVLVMDWGLALPFGDKFEKSRSVSTSPSMGGTPAYMAPEMATGPFDKMGPASDVYLLGAILYEIVTGNPPHRGKDVMKCLFAAAKNQIVPTDKTGELVDIALKAMATKVEDRYETVQDLATAVRGYLEHSESIVMSVRAADELEQAKESDSYDAFSRSLFGFEEAHALWDGNERAQSGIAEAKLAYAASALQKGDFDLGTSLLDPDNPDHSDLAVQIDEARRDREKKHQRAQQLKRLVVIMATAGFIAAIAVSAIMYSLKSIADRQREIAVDAQVEAEAARAEEAEQRRAAVAAQEEEAKQRKAAVAAQQAAEYARQEEEKQRQAAEKAKLAAEHAQKEEEKQRLAAVAAQQAAENARSEEEKQRKEAVAAKIEADRQREKAEYETYIALIGLAAAKIDENAFDTARLLLKQCNDDLKNWEWGRLMHVCQQSFSEYNVGSRIDSIDFSPDGKQFVTGGWDGKATVWNSEEQIYVELPHNGLYVNAVAFSPIQGANQVATGSTDRNAFLQIWDIEAERPVRTFVGHTDAVTSVSYSQDGKLLLSTSFDNTARVWDVETGKQLHLLKGHSWWVWDAAFSPDEQSVVTVSQDGTALVWNLDTGGKSAPFSGHQGPVYAVAFSSDGTVATGGNDKQILLWSPEDIQPVNYADIVAGREPPEPVYRKLDGHKAAVRSLDFSRDGDRLLSAGNDNTVQVWHAANGSLIKTLRGHSETVQACVFSPDGKWALSGGYDNLVRLWSIEGYEEYRVLRGRVFEGHDDAVMGVAISRDGRQVVTGSRDRTAKTWDGQSGDETGSYREGHKFLASDSAFFGDNKRLLTSGVDNTVRVWDVSRGVELLRLDHTGRAAAVAVSHDDRWVLTGSDDRSEDGRVGGTDEDGAQVWAGQLWDAESGDLAGLLLDGHKVEVTAVAFSPDDRFLYTGDANGRGVLWDRATGKQLRRLGWHMSQIAAAVFLPDGSRLLTASDDKTVCQWDTRNLATEPASVVPLEPLRLPHGDSVVSLDLSADGTRAITACLDGHVRVWSVADATLQHDLHLPESPATSAALSRDGRQAICVYADDRVVRVWDLTTGRPVPGDGPPGSDVFLDFNRLNSQVWSARMTNDGTALLTVGGDEARLWDMRSGLSAGTRRELMSYRSHDAVASAHFSNDGKRLVTASSDHSARVWDVESNRSLLRLTGHTNHVNSAIFSPRDDFVLTASDDGTAKLWNATTGQLVRDFRGHAKRVHFATFSADGRLVLTASEDKTARIWNAGSGEMIRELGPHRFGVLGAAFSDDGLFVVTGSDDNEARVWDARTGELLQILIGHTAAVTSVAFSPDGKRVLTASKDFTAKLWDAGTGKEILNLRGHEQEVTSATFSKDGRSALTASRDGTAIMWLTEEWKQLAAGE